MEALWASYGSDSEDSVDFSLGYDNINSSPTSGTMSNPNMDPILLPPPPVELLQPPNSADLSIFQGDRVRSFPHVAGNYSLHIFIPVTIPVVTRKQLASSIKRISSVMASLFVVDLDFALSELCQDNGKLEQVLFGREFHISLGRTVPIKVHQIDSILSMLRHRLQFQKRYWMEFNKWDAFVNDELTRSFLSLEVTGGGLNEISKQIAVVDEIYRLHGLPEFYKNPRPHISLLWALGDASNLLKPAADELNKLNGPSGRHIFSCKFNEICCRIVSSTSYGCNFLLPFLCVMLPPPRRRRRRRRWRRWRRPQGILQDPKAFPLSSPTRASLLALGKGSDKVRENIVIATKFAAYPWRLTSAQFVRACKFSLKRLQLEQIGIGQLHWSTANYAPLQELALWGGLAAMYEKGLVRAVGVSNYGPKQLIKIHDFLKARGVPLHSAQIQYSLLSMGDEQTELKAVCDSLGIQLISYSPLGLGLLTGKYSSALPNGLRAILFRQILPGIGSLLSSLREVAERRNKTMSQVAINWCICKGTIPIPGVKSVAQVEENLGSLGWRLNSDEILELESAARNCPQKMIQNIFQTR